MRREGMNTVVIYALSTPPIITANVSIHCATPPPPYPQPSTLITQSTTQPMSDPVYSMFLRMVSSEIKFKEPTVLPASQCDNSTPQPARKHATTNHLALKHPSPSGEPPAKKPRIESTVGPAAGVHIGIGTSAATPTMMEQKQQLSFLAVPTGGVPGNGAGSIMPPAMKEQSHSIVYRPRPTGRVPDNCGKLSLAPDTKLQSAPMPSTAVLSGRAPNGSGSSVPALGVRTQSSMTPTIVYTAVPDGRFINGTTNPGRTPVTKKENKAPNIRSPAINASVTKNRFAARSIDGKVPTPGGVAPFRNAAFTPKMLVPSVNAGGKAPIETPVIRESVVQTSDIPPEINLGSKETPIVISPGRGYKYTPCTSEEMEKARESLRPVINGRDDWMLESPPSMQSRHLDRTIGERCNTKHSVARAMKNVAAFTATDTPPYPSIHPTPNIATNNAPTAPMAIDTAFIGSISRIAKAASNSVPSLPTVQTAPPARSYLKADAATQTSLSPETGSSAIVTRRLTANAANNTSPPPPDPPANSIKIPLMVDTATNTTPPPTCITVAIGIQSHPPQTSDAATNTTSPATHTTASTVTQTLISQTSNAATNTTAFTTIEIEGHVYNVPVDPVEYFHAMRREVLASYRALMDKSGTLRDFHLVWSNARKRRAEEEEVEELDERAVKRWRIEFGTGNGKGMEGGGGDEDFCAPKD